MRRFMDCNAVVAPQDLATASRSIDGMQASLGRPHDNGVTALPETAAQHGALHTRQATQAAPSAYRTCTRSLGTSPNISGA